MFDRQGRRSGRGSVKKVQRFLTETVSSKLCWYAAATQVAVDVGAQRIAHVSGIMRCGSSWACPLCAPVIRERRAQEIDTGLRTHLERGGGALLLTLTLQHHRSHTLASRLDVIAQSLGLLLRGSGWERRRDRLGYTGSIKAVEVTWGDQHGWHPHSHSALLFDRPLTPEEQHDLYEWILQRWTHLAKTKKLGSISQRHGVDLTEITDGAGIGKYVTKVEGGWSAGHELARGDRKDNSPMSLLCAFAETGEIRMARLWQEYERATYGKKSIQWSNGLRGQLLGVEEDQGDVELAASEGIDLTLLRAFVPAEVWNPLAKSGEVAQLLTEIEEGAALLLGIWAIIGGNPQPLDPPNCAPAGSSP